MPITVEERVDIVTAQEASILTLRQLKREDAANYTCIVRNREGMDTFTATLRMKSELSTCFPSCTSLTVQSLPVPPQWIKKPQAVIKILQGSSVQIECSARGDPEPMVSIAKKHGRTASLVDSRASSHSALLNTLVIQDSNGSRCPRSRKISSQKHRGKMLASINAKRKTALNRLSKVNLKFKCQVLTFASSLGPSVCSFPSLIYPPSGPVVLASRNGALFRLLKSWVVFGCWTE